MTRYPMLAMSRFRLVAAALLCTLSVAARAQGDLVQREINVASGRDVRFAVYADIGPDCTSGPLPAIKLVAAPAHGVVTVKRGTLKATNFKQCLAADVPVLVGFYRSAPDFTGTDEFELEVTYPAGRKEIQHIRVTVSGTAGSGQHI
jgi:hypothetical protein